MKRIRITRELLFFVLLLVVLAGMTAFIAIRQAQAEAQQQNFTPYSSHSARPNGTLALHEWLNAIGYRAQRIENQAFQLGEEVKLLFILAPTESITRDEALYLLNWVERGNTLVVTDDGFSFNNELFEQLQLSLDDLEERVERVQLNQPLADASLDELNARTISGLETTQNDFVEYLRADKPILLRIPRGQGTIWVASAPSLLTNANLRDADNAKFAAALVANTPRGSVIAFDEFHHGLNTVSGQTLVNAIYNTPWGWGLVLAALLWFGYLLFNGKRFGRTVPVQRTLARRTPSEYVVSMANLFRRANKRGMVLQHYRHSLKRRLGRAFHLNPELSDERYIEMLARMRPELDRVELTRILNNLRRTDLSEMELVKSAEQAVTFGKPKASK